MAQFRFVAAEKESFLRRLASALERSEFGMAHLEEAAKGGNSLKSAPFRLAVGGGEVLKQWVGGQAVREDSRLAFVGGDFFLLWLSGE